MDNGVTDSNQISAAEDGLDPFQISIPKTGLAQKVCRVGNRTGSLLQQ